VEKFITINRTIMKKNFFDKPQYKSQPDLTAHLEEFQNKFSQVATRVTMEHSNGYDTLKIVIDYPLEVSGIAELIRTLMNAVHITIYYMEENDLQPSDIAVQCIIEEEPVKGTVNIISPSGNLIERFTFTPIL